MTMVSTTHEFYRLKGFFDHWSSLYVDRNLVESPRVFASVKLVLGNLGIILKIDLDPVVYL